METVLSQKPVLNISKTSMWVGRILSALCIAFFLFDAAGKILQNHYSVDGSTALGIPAGQVPLIGILLLFITLLYMWPRTSILGALLLTAFLGGATAIMFRANQPVFFAVVFGILAWAGLYFRNDKLRLVIKNLM